MRHVAGNRREACARDLVAEREHADIGVEARRDVEPAGNRGVASDVGGLSVLLLLLACLLLLLLLPAAAACRRRRSSSSAQQARAAATCPVDALEARA